MRLPQTPNPSGSGANSDDGLPVTPEKKESRKRPASPASSYQEGEEGLVQAGSEEARALLGKTLID